jgi:hypothetical protein
MCFFFVFLGVGFRPFFFDPRHGAGLEVPLQHLWPNLGRFNCSKMGVSWNGGTMGHPNSWMVFFMENPMKMDDDCG